MGSEASRIEFWQFLLWKDKCKRNPGGGGGGDSSIKMPGSVC